MVHLGIVLIFLGFAGEGYKLREEVLLKPGQQTTVSDFTVRLDALRVSDDGAKQMVTAHTTVFRDGREFDRMYPAKWFFRKHEEQPTTEVAIRRGFAEDLYIALGAFQLEDQAASMEIYVNPLVNWIWAGFGMMALGIFIALLPEQAFAFATARIPAGAATTSMLALALVTWPAAAQSQTAQDVAPLHRTELQRKLEDQILCSCGGCKSSLSNCPMMRCHGEESQRAKLEAHLAAGKDYDAVIAAFVDEFGSQSILAAPIDRGFNRLAWIVPYAFGVAGLVVIAVMARRWSHTATPVPAGGAGPGFDSEVDERLDDELRSLD